MDDLPAVPALPSPDTRRDSVTDVKGPAIVWWAAVQGFGKAKVVGAVSNFPRFVVRILVSRTECSQGWAVSDDPKMRARSFEEG